jgi:hypothetical protein
MIKEHLDYYIILQIICYTRTIEYIVDEYSHLAILLDPHRNPFAYVARAFSPVHYARSVLSNPHKKLFMTKQTYFLNSVDTTVATNSTSTIPQPQLQFLNLIHSRRHNRIQVNHSHNHRQSKNPRSSNEVTVIVEEKITGRVMTISMSPLSLDPSLLGLGSMKTTTQISKRLILLIKLWQ